MKLATGGGEKAPEKSPPERQLNGSAQGGKPTGRDGGISRGGQGEGKNNPPKKKGKKPQTIGPVGERPGKSFQKSWPQM